MKVTSRVQVGSWALYDFANTIFSAIVLTAYFPLYFTEISSVKWPLGVTTTLAMIFAGFIIPFMGALTDQTGKTKNYLIRTTLSCIGALCLFFFTASPVVLLCFYFFACFFFHACLVFYNSLLPVVAPPEKQGFVSGLGTGVGYLGVVFAVPIANLVDKTWGRPYVFLFAALFFFLFSLPLFLWVPERKVQNPVPFRWGLLGEEWQKVWKLIKGLPKLPTLLFFLLGHFFIVDALNTMILWFLVYARETYSAPQETLIQLLLLVNIGAFFFGLVTGHLCDRLGAMKTLLLSSVVLIGTLFFLPFPISYEIFMGACILGGAFSVAGIWTTGRKVLIEIAPEEELGEYFGIFGLTIKVSVIGNLLFSILADFLSFRAALWCLLFPACLGFFFLMKSAKLARKS